MGLQLANLRQFTLHHSLEQRCFFKILNFWHCYTLRSKKTRDHVFDDKLNWKCPFTIIFGTLIAKAIGHRQMFLFSNLTYLVQLLYLGLGNCLIRISCTLLYVYNIFLSSLFYIVSIIHYFAISLCLHLVNISDQISAKIKQNAILIKNISVKRVWCTKAVEWISRQGLKTWKHR